MDIERARFNMIEQQIRPWSVLDPEILELLSVMRREDFVPPAYRAMAFTDMEIPLVIGDRATGESMLSPKVEARILQELGVRRHESVLEIGTGSGWMAALLAHRGRHVDTIEIDPDIARFASANLQRAGVANAVVRCADGSDPALELPAYDVIVLSGSVPEVPAHLLAKLAVGGRLVAIVGRPPIMPVQQVTRGPGGTSTVAHFETFAPPLRGFGARSTFKF
ncbi:MAG TPA: protein-L-isoaspartate O-methyltransferase [Burkholderiaceae bacterium]|nr:protein-L-isoaspartate O-methyltransferase [Burkholderiaceae bacterium]